MFRFFRAGLILGNKVETENFINNKLLRDFKFVGVGNVAQTCQLVLFFNCDFQKKNIHFIGVVMC